MKDLLRRLAVFKANKGLSYLDISRTLGVTEQTVSNYFSGRTKIPLDKISAIASIYHLDIDWLMHGKSSKVDNEYEGVVEEPIATYKKAKAGLLTVQNQSVIIRGLLAGAIDQLQPGYYNIFEVEGMSMFPSVCQGDKLLCRLITTDDMIDNRISVIVTDRADLKEIHSDGVWVKRCSHRKDSGYISCKSDNQDSSEPFITFRLKISEVMEVWYPVLRITGHMADPNRDIYNRLDELEGRLELLESLNE